MFKLDNKGFSLIELLVAMAIASIIILTASQFLNTVLKQYSKDNYDIKLQTETEEILNLLENWIMDGTEPVVGENYKSLTLKKRGDDGDQFTTTIYEKSGKLYYTNQAGDVVYLGNYIDDAKFEVSGTGKSVYVNLNMKFGSATYDASRKILLRNEAGSGADGNDDTDYDDDYDDDDDDDDDNDDDKIEEPTDIRIDVLSTSVVEEKKGLIASILNYRNDDKYVVYNMSVKNLGSTLDKGKLKYRLYIYYQSKDGGQTFTDGAWKAVINNEAVRVNATYHEIADYSMADVDKSLIKWTSSFSRMNVHLGYIEFDFPELSEEFKFNDTMDVELAYTMAKSNRDHFSMIMDSAMKSIYPDIYSEPQAVVYYEGKDEPIWGRIPEDIFKLSFEVVDNSTTKKSDGSYNVRLTIRKKGLDVNWSNVVLYYYWLDNIKTITKHGLDGKAYQTYEYLKISNVKCSLNTLSWLGSVYYDYVRPNENNDKHAGANGYVKFRFKATDFASSKNEDFVLSFDVDCDREGFIDDTINEWFSYNNNSHVYGVYSGKNSMTFGEQPTGNYVERVESSVVINKPEENKEYTYSKPIKSIVVNMKMDNIWYADIKLYSIIPYIEHQVKLDNSIVAKDYTIIPKEGWHNGVYYTDTYSFKYVADRAEVYSIVVNFKE